MLSSRSDPYRFLASMPRNAACLTRDMKPERSSADAGKVRTGVLLWALGVPLPLILLFVLFRGCV